MLKLIDELSKHDFGIFVFQPDDTTTIRSDTKSTVRDNVLFEMGLFLGKLSLDHVFFAIPNTGRKDLHLPSDFIGVTPGEYEADRTDGNWDAAVSIFTSQVKTKIKGYINPNRLGQLLKDQFSNIFGKDVLNKDYEGLADFTLVLPKLKLEASYNLDGSFNSFPYKASDDVTNARIDSPVPLTEVEGMIDLSATIAQIIGYQPKTKTDVEVFASMDISYCSLGGLSSKTHQLLSSRDNSFYEFNYDAGNVVRDKQDHNIRFQLSHIHDYAIILKIRPRRFPNRVQICVVGMETWGTRGACYFLAHKWKQIEVIVGDRSFGAVIEVERNIPQSAVMVAHKLGT